MIGLHRSVQGGRTMKINLVVLAGSIGTLMLAGANVPAAAQQDNARPAIAEYVKHWQDTYNAKDAHTLAMLYTKDAVRVLPSGQLISGRQDIEKRLLEELSQDGVLSLDLREHVSSEGN